MVHKEFDLHKETFLSRLTSRSWNHILNILTGPLLSSLPSFHSHVSLYESVGQIKYQDTDRYSDLHIHQIHIKPKCLPPYKEI